MPAQTANSGVASPVLSVVARHLKSLSDDLSNTSGSVSPEFRDLYSAALVLLAEISDSMLSHDKVELHRRIILASMDFTQRWEMWIDSSSESLKYKYSKAFHEYLLRYVKGCIKGYRIWRIDLQR